jgi:nucleotide-binding universal stress UspA family protein
MLENILIAIDGSMHSQKAEDAGIELARISKGKVTALNVVKSGSEPDAGNMILKQTEEKAKKAGVPFQGKIIEGHPATEIMKFAEDSKMNIIVIGSLGVTGIKKLLIGSVTEAVIRHSKVPVLVVY